MIDHKMEMKLTIERVGKGTKLLVEIHGAATEKEIAEGLLELIDHACQNDQKFRVLLALLLLAGEHAKGVTTAYEATFMDGKTYEAMRKRGQA